MFCKLCDNFMDITDNVIAKNHMNINDILISSGGYKDESSSDYDISSSDKNLKFTDKTIIDILNDDNINIDFTGFKIDDLNKYPSFNKLNETQKTLIINKINDRKKTSFDTDFVISSKAYFECKNCKYNEIIPNGTFIFGNSNNNNSQDNFTDNFLNYKFDNTFPFVIKYNCINKSCETHKNPHLKKALIYRLNKSYVIRYVCTICNHYWNSN